VRVLHAGLIAVSLALAGPLSATCAASAAPAAPSKRAAPIAPPRLLNIVRVKVKPRTAETYAALEAQIVRAYDRAKAKVFWIGLQVPHDGTEVLYLNLTESLEAWDGMSAAYETAIEKHPELVELQQRLSKITQTSIGMLTTRRHDIDRVPQDVDFSSMRTLRLTIVEVHQGREGAFLDAIRTAPANEGSWLVYESNDTSTYALITLARTQSKHKSGLAMPRSLRRSKGIFTKFETHVYEVRPAMSRPAPLAAH